jgi:hypothetical protein
VHQVVFKLFARVNREFKIHDAAKSTTRLNFSSKMSAKYSDYCNKCLIKITLQTVKLERNFAFSFLISSTREITRPGRLYI